MMTQMFHRITPAARFLSKNFANLMLLDLNLPDGSGFQLVEELQKANVSVPVIFLTASSSEVHKVKGLEMGGDDFVSKPFSFPELIARIHAVLRRSETSKDTHITQNARLDESPFPFCGAEGSTPSAWKLFFPTACLKKLAARNWASSCMSPPTPSSCSPVKV